VNLFKFKEVSMKLFRRLDMKWLAIAVLLLMVAGCTTAPAGQTATASSTEPVTSTLSEEQATGIAENALQAYNAGDYAAWSRDWSDTMKGAIKEANFLSFREQLMESHGRYQSIASMELMPGQNPGFVRWVAIANFERGQVRFGFGFPENGSQIEGVFPEPIE
jgi:hypothetical protein